jgi:hypothetical protein
MKGFVRQEPLFSLCGLNCGLCVMHLGGYCPGCGGGAGNQNCTIAKCSIQHGNFPFCWECPEYPCPRYQEFDKYDSFVPHRNRKEDIALVQALGLEAYLTQLRKNQSILANLLANHNDGRHKTFFATAVYLLPLDDLQSVMDALDAHSELPKAPEKVRACTAVKHLQAAAHRRNIRLQLTRKPKKE